MAQDCGGNSVATTPLNWWYLHAANSVYRDNNRWNNQANPNSSSSCEEDISVSTSFTNASNHSSLTVESSRRLVDPPRPSSNELMTEHTSDNHLWSHVLSGVGSNVELHNGQEIGENFLEALSSKNMTSSMFEPACDYLKKLDHTSWEYSGGSTSFNCFENKHLNDTNNNNGFSDDAMINENNERLTKLSNLVSTWSIAPPDPEVSSHHHHHHHHFDHNHPPTNNSSSNMSLGSSMEHHQFPQSFGDSTSSSCHIGGESSRNSSGVLFPNCYDDDQDMKARQEFQQAGDVQGAVLGKSFNTTSGYHQNGLLVNNNGLSVRDNGKFYQGLPNITSCTRNFSDVISFNSRLGRPVIGIHTQKPNMKYLNSSESKKQAGVHTVPSPPNGQIRSNNGRGEGTTAREVKKKRSEESSEAILKKPKQDTSTASSTKVQTPKVKLGDKITALQQIVSPFGKTDTASVLFEAIGYIKFLQEQVQLLSNPYLKSNSHKEYPWGSLDRKDKEDGKLLELRSKGLCLVPTSCTPIVYRDNSGPDYWTPAYRGCLYR